MEVLVGYLPIWMTFRLYNRSAKLSHAPILEGWSYIAARDGGRETTATWDLDPQPEPRNLEPRTRYSLNPVRRCASLRIR